MVVVIGRQGFSDDRIRNVGVASSFGGENGRECLEGEP